MTEKANFKVDPRLAKLLGESYRSTEYALKELVDNAWDAEALHFTHIAFTKCIPLPRCVMHIVMALLDHGSTIHTR